MSASILGIGAVSALGCGIQSLESGLRGIRRPHREECLFETSEGVISLPVFTAKVEGLDRFVPARKLRRLDNFSRMALLSAHQAVEDSGAELGDRSRVGVIFGSGYGPTRTTFEFQDSMIDYGDKCASPTNFASSVHNTITSQISLLMQITGPCLTVTCFGQTTAGVLMAAKAWLEQGKVDYVLAGVGDEYCPVRGYGVARAFLAKRSQAATGEQNDFPPPIGEGFVAFLLGGEKCNSHYGRLQAVIMGGGDRGLPSALLNELQAVILSENSDCQGKRHLDESLAEGVMAAAYTDLVGAMPVAGGFDLAIASLSLKNRTLYAPADSSRQRNCKLVATEHSLPDEASVGCFACNADRSYSLITLSRK